MKKNPKKQLLLLFAILNLIFVTYSFLYLSPSSSAQEVCLSNIPDSAWAKGEPQDLNRQGLSTRFFLNAPSDFLYRYQDVPIQLRYQYIGNSCSLRTVTVTNIYSPVIQEVSVDKFIELYKSSARDLFSVEERIDLIKNANKTIDGSQLSLLVDSNLRGTLEWTSDTRKISDSLFRIISTGFPNSNFNVMVRPVLELDSTCGNSENTSDDKTFAKLIKREFLGPATFNASQESSPPVLFQLKNDSCKAKVSLIFGESPRRGEGTPLTTQNFDSPLLSVLIGEVSVVTKVATKKTTITCVKGKLTKKVTAINPKCPTGYKKK